MIWFQKVHFGRTLIKLALLASLLFAIPTATHAAESYGYFMFFAENTPDATCPIGETLFEFETKELDSETQITVNNITVEIEDATTGAVVDTVSGTNVTGSTCVNRADHKISLSVTGGPSYHNFSGSYFFSDPLDTKWDNRKIRSHIHLAPQSSGPVAQSLSPSGWSNVLPEFQVEVLDVPSIHGVTGLHQIALFTSNSTAGGQTEIFPLGGGLGVYTLSSSRVFTEGAWVSSYFVGFNGGLPDPVTGRVGTDVWGYDVTPPVSDGIGMNGSPDDTTNFFFAGGVRDENFLSGIQSITLFLDGNQAHQCVYAAPGASGPLNASFGTGNECTTPDLGTLSAGAHTLEMQAVDTAGNTMTPDTQDIWIRESCSNNATLSNANYGINPNQMQGCLSDTYEFDASLIDGDALPGTLLANPVPTTANALDFSGQTLPTPRNGGSNISAVWQGTFTFPTGVYEFTARPNVPTGVSPQQQMTVWMNVGDGNGFVQVVSPTSVEKTFLENFSTPTDVTIYITGYVDSFFGWEESVLVCDENRIGSNVFEGCLYNSSLPSPSALAGEAPPGNPMPSPVPPPVNTLLNFNWGAGTPDPLVGPDNFSARWRGSFDIPAGWFRLVVAHNNGVMVWISDDPTTLGPGNPDTLEIDEWWSANDGTDSAYFELTAEKKMYIQIDYRELQGDANITANLEHLIGPFEPCVTPTPVGINQFEGCSFNGWFTQRMLDAPIGIDVDDPSNPGFVLPNATAIDFDFGSSSPDPANLGNDQYVLEYFGNFTFRSGTYRFTATCDDEIRINFDIDGSGTIESTEGIDRCFTNKPIVFDRQFTSDTTMLIGLILWEGTGVANFNFGWTRLADDFELREVGPIANPTYIFPGQSVLGSYVVRWDVDSVPFNPTWSFDSRTVPAVMEKIETVYVSTDGQNANPLTHAHLTNFWAHLGLKNNSNAWIRSFFAPINLGDPDLFFDGIRASVDVSPPGSDVKEFRVSARSDSSPTSSLIEQDSAFHNFLGTLFSFGSLTKPPGYHLRLQSVSDFADQITVDAIVPPEVIKVGTWPKTVTLNPGETRFLEGLELTVPVDTTNFVNHPITFTANASLSGKSSSVDTTLGVWGIDVDVTPDSVEIKPGEDKQYDITVTPLNNFIGDADLSVLVDGSPILPIGMLINFTDASHSFTAAGQSAWTTTMNITTDNTLNEGVYNIEVIATADNKEGATFAPLGSLSQTVLKIDDDAGSGAEGADLPDLTVTKVPDDPGAVTEGTNLTFTGPVENIGLGNVGPNALPVTFDGTSDYLTLGTDFAPSDGSAFTVSLFMKFNGGDGSFRNILSSDITKSPIQLARFAAGFFRLLFRSATDIDDFIYNHETTKDVVYGSADGWLHVYGRVDLANNVNEFIVTRLSDDTIDTGSPKNFEAGKNIDFTTGNFSVGAHPGGGSKAPADLANVFVDNTATGYERSDFIDASNNPVNLGQNCENPNGSAPLVCLQGGVDTWHQNKGTRGGFTENGELSAATPFEPSVSFNNLFQIDVDYDGVTFNPTDNTNALNSITNLPSGETTTTNPSDSWTAVVGTHAVRLCADNPPGNPGNIAESNEDNNCGPLRVFTVTPSFDFEVVAPSSPILINKSNGSGANIPVSVNKIFGVAEAVVFSESGLPPGLDPFWSPPSCIPADPSATCSANLLLTVTDDTQLTTGDHTITVRGDASASFDTDTFILRVVTECNDGIDNDGVDGIDAADPGCWTDPLDSSTYDPNDPMEGVAQPVLSLQADPEPVRQGDPTTLTWHAQSNFLSGTCSLTATNSEDGTIISGPVSDGPASQDTIGLEAVTRATFTCLDLKGKPYSESIDVRVFPEFEEF